MAIHRKNEFETPLSSVEADTEFTSRLAEFVQDELTSMDETMIPLLAIREDLFQVKKTEFRKRMHDKVAKKYIRLAIEDQLYEHPSNNIDFIAHDMGLRQGNARKYHETTEKYDRGLSEEHEERDFVYRQAILERAQQLGFIAKEPGVATDPIDRYIGILDSELEPIDEKVAAVVINAAAGMSNLKRVRDTIRNIESGAITTDRIIISAGTRPVNDAEKGRIKPPYRAGDTEFELIKHATEDLLGFRFEGEPVSYAVEYGDNLEAHMLTAEVLIGGKPIRIEIVEAPFDDRRIMDNGTHADRINTGEAFLAVLPLLDPKDEGAIVMQSHDTWGKWQQLIALQTFGLRQGRNVYMASALNAERVYSVEHDGEQIMEIHAPQDVVDEMVKYYAQLVKLDLILNS